MKIYSAPPAPQVITRATKAQTEEPSKPMFDMFTISTAGATISSGVCAGLAAQAGSMLHGGPLVTLGAGIAGAAIGGILGGVINFKATEIAERQSTSRNAYGLVAIGMGAAASTVCGVAAGVAGNLGCNPLVTGLVGAGVTGAAYLLLMKDR